MTTTNPTTQPRKTDYRDLCIEEATARIADLEHDVVVYRELTQGALQMAATARADAERERRQRLALIEEFRGFRVMALGGVPTPKDQATTHRRRLTLTLSSQVEPPRAHA